MAGAGQIRRNGLVSRSEVTELIAVETGIAHGAVDEDQSRSGKISVFAIRQRPPPGRFRKQVLPHRSSLLNRRHHGGVRRRVKIKMKFPLMRELAIGKPESSAP